MVKEMNNDNTKNTTNQPPIKTFYNPDQVIDDLLVHQETLYWVAYEDGRVYGLNISDTDSNMRPVVNESLGKAKSLSLHEDKMSVVSLFYKQIFSNFINFFFKLNFCARI